MNLTATLLVVIILPAFMYMMGKQSGTSSYLPFARPELNLESIEVEGAERLDHSKFFGLIIGGVISLYCVYIAINVFTEKSFSFINPNYINLLLLGLCLLLHRSVFKFLKAIDQAIGGASGILIQFPLYFGIMGIMNSSGLVQLFSGFFVSISNETTFPIFTFISAGIVNIFVPSGGGQWGVQGPIILQAASELGVSIPKSIMALAYGDQLTNMLQPFWALPLLGITGLKAKEILPYTVALMGVGIVLFVSVLLIF
jgi:short-chain fatty acids transporter